MCLRMSSSMSFFSCAYLNQKDLGASLERCGSTFIAHPYCWYFFYLPTTTNKKRRRKKIKEKEKKRRYKEIMKNEMAPSGALLRSLFGL